MPHSQNCWVRQMITCGSSEGGQAGGQPGGQAGGQGQGWSSCWCSSGSCFSTEELGKVLSETSLQHGGQLDTKHQINHIMVQQHHILLSLSFYIMYFFRFMFIGSWWKCDNHTLVTICTFGDNAVGIEGCRAPRQLQLTICNMQYICNIYTYI